MKNYYNVKNTRNTSVSFLCTRNLRTRKNTRNIKSHTDNKAERSACCRVRHKLLGRIHTLAEKQKSKKSRRPIRVPITVFETK